MSEYRTTATSNTSAQTVANRATGKKKCPAPSLAGDPTESAGTIRNLLGDERQLEASLSNKRGELAVGADTAEIEHMKKRLEQIKRREEKARAEALKAAETGDMDTEAFYDDQVCEALAQRIEIQNQLRAKTRVVDFKVDMKAIAAATPEQQQKLIQEVVKRVTPLTAKEIEFSIPVRSAVNSFDQRGGG